MYCDVCHKDLQLDQIVAVFNTNPTTFIHKECMTDSIEQAYHKNEQLEQFKLQQQLDELEYIKQLYESS